MRLHSFLANNVVSKLMEKSGDGPLMQAMISNHNKLPIVVGTLFVTNGWQVCHLDLLASQSLAKVVNNPL
jgi:hypothetical protein